MAAKPRVLYIIKQFPQISETYVKAEIEAVSQEWDVLAIGLANPDLAYRNAAPHWIIQDWDEVVEAIREFTPAIGREIEPSRVEFSEDGFGAKDLPTGKGLVPFGNVEEAVAGAAEIDGNYEQHMRAARELAMEFLDSRKTLPKILAACSA